MLSTPFLRQLPDLKAILPGVLANLLEKPRVCQHGGILADPELELTLDQVPDTPFLSRDAPLIGFFFHVSSFGMGGSGIQYRTSNGTC